MKTLTAAFIAALIGVFGAAQLALAAEEDPLADFDTKIMVAKNSENGASIILEHEACAVEWVKSVTNPALVDELQKATYYDGEGKAIAGCWLHPKFHFFGHVEAGFENQEIVALPFPVFRPQDAPSGSGVRNDEKWGAPMMRVRGSAAASARAATAARERGGAFYRGQSAAERRAAGAGAKSQAPEKSAGAKRDQQ